LAARPVQPSKFAESQDFSPEARRSWRGNPAASRGGVGAAAMDPCLNFRRSRLNSLRQNSSVHLAQNFYFGEGRIPMRNRLIPLSLVLFGMTLGCGKSQPAPQSNRPQDPLEQAAQDAAMAIRRQTQKSSSELDDFAEELRGAAQSTRNDVQNRLEEEARRAKEKLSTKVDQQSQEMAEYAAEMAEDAKDRALDIPDVLDEFFGSPRENRRSGNRTDRPRR
jgi:hypothetical protein